MSHQIDIADELNIVPPIPGFQRQIFIADIFILLQFQEVGLVSGDVPKESQFPEFLSTDFFPRGTYHLQQEWIRVYDDACVSIQDQNAVFGCLEKTAVARLRSHQLLFRLFALGDVADNTKNMRHAI